jgi:hypothetical protein
MKGNRFMKKKEINNLGKSTLLELCGEIKKGHRQEALAKLEEFKTGTARLRDGLVNWIDGLLTFISQELGEEAIEQAYRLVNDRAMKQFLGKEWGETDSYERMKKRVDVYTRAHNVNVTVKEDEEKYTLEWLCDTGGELIGRKGFGKTRRAYPWSNSKKNFSYYCAHCTMAYEVLSMKEFGFPDFIVKPPQRAGEVCTQYIYKDPMKIPKKYLKMFGHL